MRAAVISFAGGNPGERIRNLRRKKAPVWLAVLAAVMCIALAGCLLTDRKGGEEHSVDFPQGMHDPTALPGNLFVGEDGKTIYYLSRVPGKSDELLYFLDTDTGIAMPMCGKPECKHNSSSCNAMLGDRGLYGIQVYDGKLWYHYDKDICHMDMDGTNRETVASIDRELLFYGGGGSGTTFFHRGWALHAQGLTNVKNGEVTGGAEVYALPLDDPEAEPEIIIQEWYPGKRVWLGYIPAGDWMYIFLKLEDRLQDVAPIDVPDDVTVMRWSLVDRTLETVWSGVLDDYTLSVDTPWVNEDCVLFYGYTTDDMTEGVYRLDLASGQMELLYETNGIPRVLGDRVASSQYIDREDGSFDVLITVTDLEGNTLLEKTVTAPEPPEPLDEGDNYMFYIIGADGDMLYMNYYYFPPMDNGIVKRVYTIRMDMTTGETEEPGGWTERNY